MELILICFSCIAFLIVLIGILNEKLFKMPFEIALVLITFILALIFKIFYECNIINMPNIIISTINNFSFDEFLINGILCFMLFAGSSKINFKKFKQNFKGICFLSFFTTLFATLIYGLIFYLIVIIFKLNMSIWLCLLLGAIISPTDPIAATSILKKLGLSENVSNMMEGESLFNDGIGVALFLCIKNIVDGTSTIAKFPILLIQELLGALVVGFSVSFLLFLILKKLKSPTIHIFISLLAVSTIYIICEHLGFSGVIASVVSGMTFSYLSTKYEANLKVVDDLFLYKNFWDIIDNVLNYILFILIGLSIIQIDFKMNFIVIGIIVITINLLSRFIGVFISSIMINKKIPSGYNKLEFSILLSYSGLKGGLSLALAFSCKSFLPLETFEIFAFIAFITIMFTIIIQGLTTPNIYNLIENHKLKRNKLMNNL